MVSDESESDQITMSEPMLICIPCSHIGMRCHENELRTLNFPAMEYRDLENFVLLMWSGDLDEDRMLVQFCKGGAWMKPLRCRGAMALNKNWTRIYTSDPDRGYQVSYRKHVCERIEGLER